MKLKAYLLNEGRSKDITNITAEMLLKEECSDAFKIWKKRKGYIYRGFHGMKSLKNEYAYMDSTKFKDRTSANTTNEYTELINHILSSWKKYPKRNVICTTDRDMAESFGDPYHVFPYNGTKIGECPTGDIWGSFQKNGMDELTAINELISNEHGNYSNAKDLMEFTKKLHLYDFDMENYDNGYYYGFIHLWEKSYSDLSLFELLNKIVMNPDKNGFHLKKSGQSLSTDREVWFNSKALLVSFKNKKCMEELL